MGCLEATAGKILRLRFCFCKVKVMSAHLVGLLRLKAARRVKKAERVRGHGEHLANVSSFTIHKTRLLALCKNCPQPHVSLYPCQAGPETGPSVLLGSPPLCRTAHKDMPPPSALLVCFTRNQEPVTCTADSANTYGNTALSCPSRSLARCHCRPSPSLPHLLAILLHQMHF